ncbi:CDP-glucose 4,6-dehydratase [Akkermansiaceae bacterium]|nr:CDP-glucose 4,6-dehydratase [Akkermansiaceae bacterium]
MSSALSKAYQGRRVLVTGHTGFKGSWLCEWLLAMGAEVAGYALDPQPHEILYSQLELSDRLAADHRGDLSDQKALAQLFKDFQPEIVLHLAAQPLVRLSYEIPVDTFATNVMGTAYLLDAVRLAGNPCRIVAVTTDKCYENREWLHAYREEDAMGGHDPYSASKGAAEIVIASYRSSFFGSDEHIKLSSARAGNVIGGGDWAADRIVPDCIRALRQGEEIPVRNQIATRPWQHVLEPLSGYLWLGACLNRSTEEGLELTGGFNFGPSLTSNRTVADLVQELIKHTGGDWHDASDPKARHEASKLNLATDKAFHLLQWQPVWPFEETIARTAQWYLGEANGEDPATLTRQQIDAYQKGAADKALPWALP